MKRLALLFSLLLLWPALAWGQNCDITTGTGTALGNAAANLTAGSWCVFSSGSFNPGGGIGAASAFSSLEEGSGQSTNIVSDAGNGAYDPIAGQVHFTGGDHNPAVINHQHIRYTESTNVWDKPTQGAWFPAGTVMHNFGNQSEFDWYRGEFYDRTCYSETCTGTNDQIWQRYNVDTRHPNSPAAGTWTPTPILNTEGGTSGYQAGNAFFPERDEMIQWVSEWATNTAQVFAFRPRTNSWVRLGPAGGFNIGASGAVTKPVYNPVHKIVLLPGANTRNWKLSWDGTISEIAQTPIALNGVNRGTVVTADPATGDYLIFGGNGSTYAFNPLTGVTTTLSTNCSGVPVQRCPAPNAGAGTMWGSVPVAIIRYGVTMFLTCHAAACGGNTVYLYKHVGATATRLDYLRRAYAPGTIARWSFDSDADFRGLTNPGQGLACEAPAICNCGVMGFGSGTDFSRTVRDTSVKVSGPSSLKFVIPVGAGQDTSGTWACNLSPDLLTQFGAGDGDLYYQWRQRFDPALLVQANFPGSDGFKQSSMIEGDRPGGFFAPSNGAVIMTMQNVTWVNLPLIYRRMAGNPSTPFSAVTSGGFSHLQWNGGTTTAAGPEPDHVFCRFVDPHVEPGCFNYHASEWMTFMVRIRVTTWNSATGNIMEQWMCREATGTCRKMNFYDGSVVGVNEARIDNTDIASGAKYGKLWFLPYQTNLTGSLVDTATWIDDVIVSRQFIPFPGATAAPPTAPAAPTGLRIES